MLSCLSAGSVQTLDAAETAATAGSELDPISQLLGDSGIEAHLTTVADTIVVEARQGFGQCPEAADFPPSRIDRLQRAFAPDALMRDIVHEVDAVLTGSEVKQIARWMNSPAGIQVRQAESAVSELDESAFDAASARLTSSDAWTPERRALVSALVRASDAADFLTAVNTEISAAVHLAAVCVVDAASLESIDKVIIDERRDASFYAVFMGIQLLVPTGVVFESLSDTDLQAYLDFVGSPSGKRYHETLTESTRTALRAAVADLREHFGTD